MILPYHRFVPTYGRDEVPSRPKMLPYKIAFLLAVYSGQMDRTFTLDEPDHLRNRIFWRNRNHHVNVIRQMTFFDPAFLLLCQLAKHIPEVPPQLPVKRLPAALGNEHNMIFALYLHSHLLCGLGSRTRPSSNFLSCAWWLTIR